MDEKLQELEIRQLEERDLPSVIECVLDTYERDNVIMRGLGITREDFRSSAA